MNRTISLSITAALFGGLLFAACDSDETSSTAKTKNCAPTDPTCPALAIGSDCLGLVDNTGKDKFALRLAQLSVTGPEVLTKPFVSALVGNGVFINQPACNVAGLGTFSLIAEVDMTASTLRVGGAKPQAKPEDGYCYAYDPAHDIEPMTVNAQYNDDGSFTIDKIPSITLPIYLDIEASSAVYMPLRDVQLVNGTISSDRNCIGKFNADGLQPLNQCKPDLEEKIEYFLNGADLEGHITLEEADTVDVELLNPTQSLCVLLSGDAKTYGVADKDGVLRCTRDGQGNIELKGDWCASSNKPDDCQDAYRLEAGIALSSVKLRNDCPSGGEGGMAAGGSGGTSSSGSGGAGGAAAGGGGNSG